MKKCKRLLSVLLAVVLLVGAVPAYAATTSDVDLSDVSVPDGTLTWGGAAYGAYLDELDDPDVYVDWEYIRTAANSKVVYLYDGQTAFDASRDIPDVDFPDDVAVEIEDCATRVIVWTNGNANCDPVGTQLYATKTNADGTVTKYVLQNDGTFQVETGSATSGRTTSNSTGTTNSNTANTGTANTGTSGNTTSNSTTSTGTVYDDVKPGDWYYDAVMAMTDGGLVSGYGNGKFGPNDPITVIQMELILLRLTGAETVHEWNTVAEDWQDRSDVYGYGWTSKPWFWDQYMTASSLGYINCVYNARTERRGWEHQLTRYEAVTMLYNVFTYSDQTLEKTLYARNVAATGKTQWTLDEIGDKDEIVAYAEANYISKIYDVDRTYVVYYPILFAYDTGLVSGMDSQHSFGMNNTITRAQLCQILYNAGLTHAGDFTGADNNVYQHALLQSISLKQFLKEHPNYHCPGTSWNGRTELMVTYK